MTTNTTKIMVHLHEPVTVERDDGPSTGPYFVLKSGDVNVFLTPDELGALQGALDTAAKDYEWHVANAHLMPEPGVTA